MKSITASVLYSTTFILFYLSLLAGNLHSTSISTALRLSIFALR